VEIKVRDTNFSKSILELNEALKHENESLKKDFEHRFDLLSLETSKQSKVILELSQLIMNI